MDPLAKLKQLAAVDIHNFEPVGLAAAGGGGGVRPLRPVVSGEAALGGPSANYRGRDAVERERLAVLEKADAPLGHEDADWDEWPELDERLLGFRRGDVVIVRSGFFSDSEKPVRLKRGQRGQILKIDREGDAYVSFQVPELPKQWVCKKNLEKNLVKLVLQEGDAVITKQEFFSDGEPPQSLHRGQRGVVVLATEDGDVCIQFDDYGPVQKVCSASCALLAQVNRETETVEYDPQRPVPWRYVPPEEEPWELGRLEGPDLRGPSASGPGLQPGEIFGVTMERRGPDGVLYLKIEDGRGWSFQGRPGTSRLLCERFTGNWRPAQAVGEAPSPRRQPLTLEESKEVLMLMQCALSGEEKPGFQGWLRGLLRKSRDVPSTRSALRSRLWGLFQSACTLLAQDFGFQGCEAGFQEMFQEIRAHRGDPEVVRLATYIETTLLQVPRGSWFLLGPVRPGVKAYIQAARGTAPQLDGIACLVEAWDEERQRWRVTLTEPPELDAVKFLEEANLSVEEGPESPEDESEVSSQGSHAGDEEAGQEDEVTRAEDALAERLGHGRRHRGQRRKRRKQEAESLAIPWWVAASQAAYERARDRLPPDHPALMSGSASRQIFLEDEPPQESLATLLESLDTADDQHSFHALACVADTSLVRPSSEAAEAAAQGFLKEEEGYYCFPGFQSRDEYLPHVRHLKLEGMTGDPHPGPGDVADATEDMLTLEERNLLTPSYPSRSQAPVRPGGDLAEASRLPRRVGAMPKKKVVLGTSQAQALPSGGELRREGEAGDGSASSSTSLAGGPGRGPQLPIRPHRNTTAGHREEADARATASVAPASSRSALGAWGPSALWQGRGLPPLKPPPRMSATETRLCSSTESEASQL